MSGILVMAESRRGELREVSLELIGAALTLKDQAGGRVAVAIVGADGEHHAGALGVSGVDDTHASITWLANEASTSLVRFGPVKPPVASASTPGLAVGHAVALSGLEPCTIYWFSVESRDPAGNVAVDDNGKVRPLDVKAGDKILFGKYSGTEVKIDGEEHLILREEDILGVIEG